MVAAVETMAWKGDKPWHGLGTEIKDTMSPAQMMKAAGLDWTVSKRPISYHKFDDKGKPNGATKAVPKRFALVRDSDESCLSVVGDVYKEVQNSDAFDFFQQFCDAGHMTMETAGSLWGGRHVWALARVGKDFKLGSGKTVDEVRAYLLLSSAHVHGKANAAAFTPIRVVCWNTLNMALGSNLDGKGGNNAGAFRMPHVRKFDQTVKDLAKASLGIAVEQADEFKEAAIQLSKLKIDEKGTTEYFSAVLKFDPKKAAKKKNEEVKVPRMLPKFQAALTHSPGHALPSALGTLWGALNAVTYVVDHEETKNPDTQLKNIWMGHKATIKRRALHLAMQMVK